jgi:chemotaxis protein methyltransferase CheR
MLTDSQFKLFRDLIYQECGVNLGQEKKLFLESRLQKRMKAVGAESLAHYYEMVKSGPERSRELPRLLDALMICETSFFRNLPQFELLREIVLPDIIDRKRKLGLHSIRVWSAGCSTGQEPYSAAMIILEALGKQKDWTVRIFASDLSFTALEWAEAGLYTPDQIKGVEDYFLNKYFWQENGHYAVREEIKRMVIFDYHNLKHDNGLRGLDIIFCRNVMIYFDLDEQRRLIERFAKCLVPGGYLFLGHAETALPSSRFKMIHRNKGIAYKLEG